MRTYQSQNKNDGSKKQNKKLLYSLLIAAGIVIIATIITLSLTLGRNNVPAIDTPAVVDPGPDPGIPGVVDPDPEPPVVGERQFNLPIEGFTLGKAASLQRVVYSSSMGYYATHNGTDFQASAGTDVLAISAGTVLSIDYTILDATVISIDHGDGIVSIYMGLSDDVKVAAGDTVSGGEVIGTVAEVMPHERTEGSHLHLEIKVNGKWVDPAIYLEELGGK